jgi:hypothetical protein
MTNRMIGREWNKNCKDYKVQKKKKKKKMIKETWELGMNKL